MNPGIAVARLRIRPDATTTSVPKSFLGLSTEYWTLPVDERRTALYARIISMLHAPGDGPFVLRVGGDSADHAFYGSRIAHAPSWVFDLTPRLIARTAKVVRELGLKVILDLNLVTATAQQAGAWAVEAQKAMPRGSIIGYEIGNEPDLYSRSFWQTATRGILVGGRKLRGAITPMSYTADYNAYERVLHRVVPRAALLAPALANPAAGSGWMRTLLAGSHPDLRVITGHRYPYDACALPRSPRYPTVARILSAQASSGMAQSTKVMALLAKRAGLTARLTEFNSVTCGGLSGVSNTFATALWAPDAIFELIRAGLGGVNLHARAYPINGPFTFTGRGLLARPLLYGLIMFTRTLGPEPRLVALQLHQPPSIPLKAWAVKAADDRLHVLLIDKGPRRVKIGLTLPATARATVQRLLAPSVTARSGETLAGQSLDRNGRWTGARQTEVVAPKASRYLVTTSPYSATLLSVPITPGALHS